MTIGGKPKRLRLIPRPFPVEVPMSTNKLLELYVDEFISELVAMFMDGDIDSDKVEKIIKKYSKAHEGVYGLDDYDDLQRMFGDELKEKGYFE